MKKLRFIRSIQATVLAKNVEHLPFQTGIAGDSAMAYGLQRSAAVQYRITFETEEGKVLYMAVPLQVYLSLKEGDVGTLRHSGKFQNFETGNTIPKKKIEA